MKNRFPLTAKYDTEWVNNNQMGPNPLWLLEDLVKDMNLSPGMKVMDLGCGRALTSIFLAKEFGVQVWASDLWINPTENLSRIKEAGVEHLVFPLRVEAHAMPFAERFFDSIVSIDAYHYFGTDDLFLPAYLKKILKKDGELGIVVPGVTEEITDEEVLPEKLREVWSANDFYTFHSADWWNRHLSKSKTFTVQYAESVVDGRELWINSNCDNAELEADTGKVLTFVKVIATKN